MTVTKINNLWTKISGTESELATDAQLRKNENEGIARDELHIAFIK